MKTGSDLLLELLRLRNEDPQAAQSLFESFQEIFSRENPKNQLSLHSLNELHHKDLHHKDHPPDCPCSLLSNNVDECYRNAMTLAAYINHQLEPYGVKISTVKLEQHLSAPIASKEAIGKQFVRDPDGNILGRIYETTARAFVDIIKHVIEVPGTTPTARARQAKAIKRAFKILIRGACQSGKMCIISMAYYLLPPLVYAATDRQIKLVSVLNLVQYTSLQSHTRKEMRGFRVLYGDLVVESQTYSLSINDYIDMQKRDGSFLSDEEQDENCVVIRSSRGIKVISDTLNTFIQKGYTPIVFTDECHFGSEKNGGQDRLLRSIPRNVAQIAISATADEVLSRNVSPEWHKVDLPLGKNYVGPGSYDGHRLPSTSDYVEILPENMEINAWLNANGIRMQHSYSRKAYSGPIGYCQIVADISSKKKAEKYYYANRDTCDRAFATYQRNFELATLSMLRKLFERTDSITIRAFSTNEASLKFMQKLRTIQTTEDNFVLAPFFKEQNRANGKANVKEYLAGFREQKVVLFVTGDARMGCAFPASNNVFIDLSEAKSYTNTIIQGLYGRACGYNKVYNGKVPLVLLSTVTNATIEALKCNNWQWKHGVKNPGPRTVIQESRRVCNGGRRPQNVHLLLADQENPHCFEISKIVNEAWKQSNRLHRTDLKRSRRDDTLLWNTILKSRLLTAEFLTNTVYEIEPALRRFRFLLLGQIDPSTGRRYDVTTYVDQSFLAVFGIRTTRGFGTVSRNTRRNAGDVVEPQLSIEFVPNIACPICETPCIATRLYALKEDYCKNKRSDGGHWPEAALESCCWQYAEIKCTSIHLRIAEHVLPSEDDDSDFIAKPNSRFLLEGDASTGDASLEETKDGEN